MMAISAVFGVIETYLGEVKAAYQRSKNSLMAYRQTTQSRQESDQRPLATMTQYFLGLPL